MSKPLKPRRGTTAEQNAFVGEAYEVTYDTDKNTLVCRDGLTAGGFPLAHEAEVVAKVSSLDSTLRGLIAEEVAKAMSAAIAAQSSADGKLPLDGGTMTGNINFSSQYAYLTKAGTDGFITICSTTSPTNGGFFRSYGLNYSGENPGAAAMCAVDSDGVNHNAVMKPSGQMTINGSLAVTGEYVHVQQATSGSMYLPAGGTWSYVVISKNSSGGVGTCIASTKAGGTAVWTYNGATVSAGWLIAIRVA